MQLSRFRAVPAVIGKGRRHHSLFRRVMAQRATPTRLARDRRAGVSVEMALTSMLFLLPLFAGEADFLSLLATKFKMNAALRAFYAYAWNNPAGATNTTQLAAILAHYNTSSLPTITFPDGNAGPSTTYQPSLTYLCTAPYASTASQQSTPCPSGDSQQTLVSYSLAASISLPIPLPVGLTSPFPLSASGQVQIQ